MFLQFPHVIAKLLILCFLLEYNYYPKNIFTAWHISSGDATICYLECSKIDKAKYLVHLAYFAETFDICFWLRIGNTDTPEVPCNSDLESFLLRRLPGTAKLLSMARLGTVGESPPPGLRFFRPAMEEETLTVVVAEMEDEVEDVDTVVYCEDRTQEVERVNKSQ